MSQQPCELCNRPSQTTTHHLIPKSCKKKSGPTAELCQDCHRMIHATFDNKQLAKNYHSIELLKNAIQPFIKWIRKQPACTYFNSKKFKKLTPLF